MKNGSAFHHLDEVRSECFGSPIRFGPLAAKQSQRVILSVRYCHNCSRERDREITFQPGNWRFTAFYSRYDERMVTFTNDRPQENATVPGFLSWHCLCSDQSVWLKAPRKSCWSKTTTRFESCSRCL